MRRLIARYKMELFLCLRVTLAALLTFVVGRILGVPVILWAVLTSVLLTQMSVGKSVKATIDYFAGTLGGAIYAGAISALIPQTTDAGLLAALAAAVAPLALLSAVWPRYAAAPSTGLIVVVAPTLTHATPLVSAIDRVEEVALGAVVALVVSLVVCPRGRAIWRGFRQPRCWRRSPMRRRRFSTAFSNRPTVRRWRSFIEASRWLIGGSKRRAQRPDMSASLC